MFPRSFMCYFLKAIQIMHPPLPHISYFSLKFLLYGLIERHRSKSQSSGYKAWNINLKKCLKNSQNLFVVHAWNLTVKDSA